MQDKIKKIRDACIAANPEIIELDPHPDALGGFDPSWEPRPIRLADVLLAVRQWDLDKEKEFKEKYKGHPPVKYSKYYQFMQSITAHGMDGEEFFWNLKDDNLENQSEECVDLIHGLL